MRFKSRYYNSLAQGVSGKNEQPVEPPWRGAQCSCIGCISLRPALTTPNCNALYSSLYRDTAMGENLKHSNIKVWGKQLKRKKLRTKCIVWVCTLAHENMQIVSIKFT